MFMIITILIQYTVPRVPAMRAGLFAVKVPGQDGIELLTVPVTGARSFALSVPTDCMLLYLAAQYDSSCSRI